MITSFVYVYLFTFATLFLNVLMVFFFFFWFYNNCFLLTFIKKIIIVRCKLRNIDCLIFPPWPNFSPKDLFTFVTLTIIKTNQEGLYSVIHNKCRISFSYRCYLFFSLFFN